MKTEVCVSAGRSSRPAPFFLLGALFASLLAVAPAPAAAQASWAEVSAALRANDDGSRSVRTFYKLRGHRPLWIRGGRLTPDAFALLDLFDTAHLDGIDTRRLRLSRLDDVLRKSNSGTPRALARAENALSETFAAYVQAVRRPVGGDIRYENDALAPAVPTEKAVLDAAAAAPSLSRYIEEIGWMHPLYAGLRRALADPLLTPQQARLVQVNLDRVRAIPANPARRYVIVDAAAARLYMYEDGKVRDSMRVVVGKPDQQTPTIAGFISYAILNPYWNVPPDLVPTKVAPGVLKQGPAYLRSQRYEILSDWSENARVLDPKSIDWRSVAAGQRQLRVRQLPGRGNSMGDVKFMFPNQLGIYLHDTPDKHLMKRASRQYSSGCVRLEDAARLGRWLFNKPLKAPSSKPEQRVSLPEPVPVYNTYLTVAPEGERLAFRSDPYRRDQAALAMAGGDMRGTR